MYLAKDFRITCLKAVTLEPIHTAVCCCCPVLLKVRDYKSCQVPGTLVVQPQRTMSPLQVLKVTSNSPQVSGPSA